MLGSVKLTLPANRTSSTFVLTSDTTHSTEGLCSTCGCVCLGYGVDPVHGQLRVVLLLPLQGEHHFRQGVSDPPPLQNHTWQRVQRAKLLQNILSKPLQVRPNTASSKEEQRFQVTLSGVTLVVLNCFPSRTLPPPLLV